MIQWLPPQGFFAYNKLQQNAFVVLSDSGTIFEESSILNFRALNIRESHERPEAMESTPLIMSGLNTERLLQSIESILNSPKVGEKIHDYEQANISIKVERILISYTDYINRVVWQKES